MPAVTKSTMPAVTKSAMPSNTKSTLPPVNKSIRLTLTETHLIKLKEEVTENVEILTYVNDLYLLHG
jgi:hypothetical protein